MPRCSKVSRINPVGLTMHRLIQPPSDVRKLPINGFLSAPPEVGIDDRVVTPFSIPCVSFGPAAHHAVLSRDTSTSTASPLRSRYNSAAAMPPAMFIPPMESPKAGLPCDSG